MLRHSLTRTLTLALALVMALVTRKDRSAEKTSSLTHTHTHFRPVAVCSADSFVLALLCHSLTRSGSGSGSEYHFALWDRACHRMSATELHVQSAKVCKITVE